MRLGFGFGLQYSKLSGGGFEGILNQFPGASLGLSLRLLDINYTGFCIKVRRSSDNNELDIGFVNNELDTASLLTFVGSGDAFVSIWYGQDGNNNNAMQTVSVSQPKIVSNGSLILENGKPTIFFDGVDDFFYTDNYSVELSANDAQTFVVNTPFSEEGGSTCFVESDQISPYSSNFILGSARGDRTLWVNTTLFGSAQVNAQQVFGFEKTGGPGTGSKNFQAYKNGATDGNSGNATVKQEVYNKSSIGATTDGTSTVFKGNIQSVIAYKNTSNTYLEVMSKINEYYSTY